MNMITCKEARALPVLCKKDRLIKYIEYLICDAQHRGVNYVHVDDDLSEQTELAIRVLFKSVGFLVGYRKSGLEISWK